MYAHRAQDVARLREPGMLSATSQAEIRNPQLALSVDEQIGRLHIAVHDADFMDRVECLGCLNAQPSDFADAVAGGPGARNDRVNHRGCRRATRRVAILIEATSSDDNLLRLIPRLMRAASGWISASNVASDCPSISCIA